jgi:hypothetical protein
MNPVYVHPSALQTYIASDGSRFTELIREWGSIYFRRCGATNFSINAVSWVNDGGVDGVIDDERLKDPKGWFHAKTVMQFKAGKPSLGKLRGELFADAKSGRQRIKDEVMKGFKVVWFIGKALPDIELKDLEEKLSKAVRSVNPDAPEPTVIDFNRLAELISHTPDVALKIYGCRAAFLTSNRALEETPHCYLPKFVPSQSFEVLREEIIRFFLNPDYPMSIKFIAGEPGTGKTRSVLEAVESSDELRGRVCYFPNITGVDEFFRLAKQYGLLGYAIVDEFFGQSDSAGRIDSSTVPKGFRVLLIGHAYMINRKTSSRITDPISPPTGEDIRAILSQNFEDLPEFRIHEAVRLSGNNIRLAAWICDYYRKNPNCKEINPESLWSKVEEELLRERDDNRRDVIKRLSLVPYLLDEEIDDFCELVKYEAGKFRDACGKISDTSALIRYDGQVAYVSIPVVAQWALRQFWKEEREIAKEIFKNPQNFGDRIILAIKRLPPCSEKNEMLDFFRLPIESLTLSDLCDRHTGQRFLNLLTADPDTYLPVLHRVVMESRGRLKEEFPYEGTGVGRREVIHKLRDLAQFEEYFKLSEEIVYAFCKEEAPSAYINTATSYWCSWFQAYFDFTTYPYEKRLALLERRAKDGDEIDKYLVIEAIKNPFPQVSKIVPSPRVGGRIAPLELNFVRHEQVELAKSRIPQIVRVLLRCPQNDIRQKVANAIVESRLHWLRVGATNEYIQMVTDEAFPIDARRRLAADVRHNIELVSTNSTINYEIAHTGMGRNQIIEQYRRLLEVIDDGDPTITVIEVAEHEMWEADNPETPQYTKLSTLANQCLADRELFERTVEILGSPETRGGRFFGRLLGRQLSEEQFEVIQSKVKEAGLSQFTYSTLAAAAEVNSKLRDRLRSLANELEISKPNEALSIYRLFGDEAYFREAARMISTMPVPARLFRGFYIHDKDRIPESVWQFTKALRDRAEKEDREIYDVLFEVVGEFSRNQVDDERAYDLGLFTIRRILKSDPTSRLSKGYDIAIWLYRRYPQEILAIASSCEHSPFSVATQVLAEIAKSDPIAVLDSLVPKLRAPYESPILLEGSLLGVVQNIPAETFAIWLQKQDARVVATMAGHLPKPFMHDGKAVVPDVTRKFWEICTPKMGETYRRAKEHFYCHTINTGVYSGFGADLFSERVELAKQLQNDSLPGIREWASEFLRASERMLGEARKQQSLYEVEVMNAE